MRAGAGSLSDEIRIQALRSAGPAKPWPRIQARETGSKSSLLGPQGEQKILRGIQHVFLA